MVNNLLKSNILVHLNFHVCKQGFVLLFLRRLERSKSDSQEVPGLVVMDVSERDEESFSEGRRLQYIARL